MVFTTGLIANVRLNKMGDLAKISFDKYLVGKLLDNATHLAFTNRVLIATYFESRVTVVTFGKPLDFGASDPGGGEGDTLAAADPKISVIDLLGPPGRRLARKVMLSSDSSTCLIWWSQSGQEVFPWAPHLNEEDRANVFMFSLKSKKDGQPRRLGYGRSHSDPVLFRFLPTSNSISFVGQETTRRGEVQVEAVIFSHVEGERQLRRSKANRLSLNSMIKCCIAVNDYLCIASTSDGTLMLIDLSQNKLECQTKCTFVPTNLRLHLDKIVVLASNDKGLLQAWDIALNPVKLVLSSEAELTGSSNHVLEVGLNFSRIPIGLQDLVWCERKRTPPTSDMERSAFNYLMLRFNSGPLALIRWSGGVFGSGTLGATQMISQYLKGNNFHSALLLMTQLDWISQGETIMTCLNMTFHRLFRQPVLSRETESLMEMCLGLFYAPSRPIPDEVMDEFAEQVHDIARKFFHRLIRHGQVTKAFRLAVDINDYDLFIDLYHLASRSGMTDLAEAAMIKAQAGYADGEDVSSRSDGGSAPDEDQEQQLHPEVQQVQPELHVSSLPRPGAQQQEQQSHQQLPGPLQLFSSLRSPPDYAQVSHRPPQPQPQQQQQQQQQQPQQQQQQIQVEDEEPVSSLESGTFMQPQLSATYLRTTSAKRISTNEYQTKAEITAMPTTSTLSQLPPNPGTAAAMTSGQAPVSLSSSSLASLPKAMAAQATKLENPDDIEVIHFGVV